MSDSPRPLTEEENQTRLRMRAAAMETLAKLQATNPAEDYAAAEALVEMMFAEESE